MLTAEEKQELKDIKKMLKSKDFCTYEDWERLVELNIKEEKD